MGWWNGMAAGAGVWALLLIILLVALIVLVVLAVVWLARRLGGPARGQGRSQETAEEILRHRYASGEIDEQEFRRRRDALS